MENRIKEIVEKLNQASAAYYNGMEIMSNREWDAMFDELKILEEESGIVLPDSPTAGVGAAPKVGSRVTHDFPALSLDKTKDPEVLKSKFSGEEAVLIMWKLDGGTLQLTYDKGRLIIAATRGNGEVGQDITANAIFISGIPTRIDYGGRLVIRGEALMSYSDFSAVNEELPEDSRYANPRNLANATVSMLDPSEVKKRRVHFKPFGIVHMSEDLPATFTERMESLKALGFDPVDYELIFPGEIPGKILEWSAKVETYDYPVDGLVFSSNDISRAERLPGTGHHPNVLSGFAFKWADTLAETTLREIEWSPSRTGLLNPVAIFDGVDLEGTSVSRASLHNVSYIREKHLRVGDKINVYKANMIIPQILDNLSENEAPISDIEMVSMIPDCPVCGMKAELRNVNDVETMHCTNPDCPAKAIGKFTHFCSRDCMDIEGLSEATLTRFVEEGFLKNLKDIYALDRHEGAITAMEGFGEKSYNNLINAINASRNRDIVAFLTAIGIPGIGKGQAKLIANHFLGKAGDVIDAVFATGDRFYDFALIDGFGEVLRDSIHRFAETQALPGSFTGGLLSCLDIQDIKVVTAEGSPIAGKIFVITGAVNHFANREELKAKIESLGGKATGSVSAKTDFLINNDSASTSGKNKKAAELNVPVVTEEEFLAMIGEL